MVSGTTARLANRMRCHPSPTRKAAALREVALAYAK
jgi:hypothetical protein